MKRIFTLTLVVLFALCLTNNAIAGASKEEVMTKCKEAADFFIKNGLEAAKQEINNPKGIFVWKDTYVFILDMDGIIRAHPIKPKLIDNPKMMRLKDINGKLFFYDFVNVAKEQGQGWVDYMWPKPGEKKPSHKNTFIYRIPGTDYVMGAGIYE
ncbi:Double Cache domain-containing protein [Candidatus Magnetomoraceae bacterium gMMP-15]